MASRPLSGAVTPSPVNNSDARNANALAPTRVYSGEVLLAFKKQVLAERLFNVKTLDNGISMKFPILGTGGADQVLTHTAGTEISVNTRQAGERVITIGELLYDSVLIDRKDAKVLDFDVTSQYTESLGYSLADALDKTLFALLKTATTTTGIAGQPDGSWIANTVIASGSTAEAKGNALVTSIFEANKDMDENNVPKTDRYCVTTTENYYNIAQATKVQNRDFQVSHNTGVDMFPVDMMMIGNTKVIASNNLTTSDNFEAYVFQRDCIGLVNLISVITESTYMPTRFADLMTARYCYGAGVLNGGLVVGIRSASDAF